MLRKLEYELTQADIDYKRFGIGKKNSGFFLPPSLPNKKPFPFDLETDIDSIKTTIRQSTYRIGKGLKPWFKAHCKLNARDKIVFTVIESMKKYRLEIVK